MALSYLEIGSHRQAIAELEQAIRLSDENAVFVGTLGFALAKSGDEQAALHMLDKLEERSRLGYVPADLPGNVLIRRRKSGLPKDSVANVSQIATVDRGWLSERVGSVTRRQIDAVEEGLRLLLGLQAPYC
ncbi:MAG: hypothetical protein E2P02_08420 [Acidobacteria bacterium]|nr:MAG: hypothetical protein E2P02_08420 [Acidobacteriota bacterium]